MPYEHKYKLGLHIQVTSPFGETWVCGLTTLEPFQLDGHQVGMGISHPWRANQAP